MDIKDLKSLNMDSELVITHGLEKLSLQNVSNDIFDLEDEAFKCNNTSKIGKNDIFDLEGETVKCSNKFKIENNLISVQDSKEDSKYQKYSKCINAVLVTDPSSEINIKQENCGDEKILNENSVLSEDSLNNLLSELDLSDSDNEEKYTDDVNQLVERGPHGSRKQISKVRESAQKIYDRSEFNNDRLRSLSGGQFVETNSVLLNTNNGAISLYSFPCVTENINVPVWDSGDDSRNTSVSSPESGYDTSQSLTGSPPHIPLSVSNVDILDHLAQTVDEEIVLESVVEMEPGVCSYPTLGVDDKDCIEKLMNYLKDEEQNESFCNSNINTECVPQVIDVNTSDPSENSCSSTINKKSIKRILPMPPPLRRDDARKELRSFLVDDIKLQFERKMMLPFHADKNAKVIYVENDSEIRTNLHNAVINKKLEEIYCLVEFNRQQEVPCDLNVRDKYGKTALDYAIENDITLVINYLKENDAQPSLKL